MKKLILLVIGFYWAPNAFAEQADGYIIELTGDTVKGKVEVPVERKEIRYDKLTFDIKFARPGEGMKKIDREKLKGFGFAYAGKNYDFVTWKVKDNKQVAILFTGGAVEPNGVYFIHREDDSAYIPFYGLYLEGDEYRFGNTKPQTLDAANFDKTYTGPKVHKFVVVKHPSMGMLYLAGDLTAPQKKEIEFYKYLGLDDQFIPAIEGKKLPLQEIFKQYNQWKKTNP